jgi:HD-GYP domain-containing protein (c-di-GMP phosphodiesterase class II)
MNVPEAELVHLRRGAILHDIGKLAIPDSVLLKPDRLTNEEYAIMKRHTRYAHAMLAPISFLRPALDIPRFHHEKWDGTGYPHGLCGTQIPLAARIFAVIDVYDALCSDRPYRAGWPPERVCAYIAAHAGTHFDPEIVDVFLSQVVHVPAPKCPVEIIPEA